MKSIFIFLFFGTHAAFTQVGFEFPENLLFDPYDYKITRLGFKEVLQYRTWDNAKPDSSGGTPIEFSMQYVIAYDSLQNISCYKFDFESRYHWQYLAGSKLPGYRPKPIKDSTHYYFYNHEDSTHALVFQNYSFKYEDKNLAFIQIQDAYKSKFGPIAGVLDGIYYQADTVVTETTERTYDSNNRLVQTRIIRDNVEIELWRYYYERFEDGDNNAYLLSRAELDFEGLKMTYHLEYLK